MWIMNVVWPITGLYAGPIALWGYFAYGRADGHDEHAGAITAAANRSRPSSASAQPIAAQAARSATSSRSGWHFRVPAVAVWFGWHSLFAEKMFAVWILDFVFAFAIGIVFQYFAIVPMRELSFRRWHRWPRSRPTRCR